MSARKSPQLPDAFAGGRWSRMRRTVIVGACAAFLTVALLPTFFHVLTFHPDSFFTEKIHPDAMAQFSHLKRYYDHLSLKDADRWNSTNDNNLILTEWPVFSNSFFVYALRDMAIADPGLKPQAVKYMRLAIEETMRKRCYGYVVKRYGDPFDESNELRNNALYLGHLNMMLGCYRQVSGDDSYDRLTNRISKALYNGVMASPTYSIESYPGECWPCDNAVAMASLKLHDDLFKSGYSLAGRKWVGSMRRHLDPKTGIMPALISVNDGEIFQGPRSVCLGYSLPFVAAIDPEFAKDQWMRSRRFMYASRWGLAGMREYPRGNNTLGDIDTGPLIFGIGPASTAFMLGGAKAMGDRQAFDEMLRTGEMLGWPVSYSGGKRYLISVRVGDSVVLWAKTRRPLYPAPKPRLNQTGLIGYSVLFLGVFLGMMACLAGELRKLALSAAIHRAAGRPEELTRIADRLETLYSRTRFRPLRRRYLSKALHFVRQIESIGPDRCKSVEARLDDDARKSNSAALAVSIATTAAGAAGLVPWLGVGLILLTAVLVLDVLDRRLSANLWNRESQLAK